MSATNPYLRKFLERFPVPLTAWLAPGASADFGPALRAAMPRDAQVRTISPEVHIDRAAVLVLTPRDIMGPAHETLLAQARRMVPGRPLLVGGNHSKDVLIEAINTWRIYSALPRDASPDAVGGAIRKAHEALLLDVAIDRAVVELRTENAAIEEAIQLLEMTQHQLLHTERLSTMGRMTDGLITAIRAHLEALDDFERAARAADLDEECLQMLHYAFEGVRSIGALLDEMNAYAEHRERTPDLEPVELDLLLERVIAFSRFDKAARGRLIDAQLTSNARVSVDRHRLYQVVINLLRNAFQATEEGDCVTIRTSAHEGNARIEVQDAGCGMSEETKGRVFDPFFSTKGEQGLGLGLSVSRRSIERQGGQLRFTSAVGEGTLFVIELPLG